MEDSLSIIFAIIVALIIMFIVPLMDTWELQDNLSYTITYSAVTDFVDTCRNVGYISLDSYLAFQQTLLSTGNTFAITMEHRDQKEVPFYDQGNNLIGMKTAYYNTYTSQIEYELYNNHIYKLDKYDYFMVSVKNTNITQASIINNLVANDNTNFKIGCAYGGCVWSSSAED